jgi:hypothetical protein
MGNISRLNEHILYLKVDDAYALWFSASRKFMMLEEPAFFVLKQIIKNKPIEEISQKCFYRYKNSIENSRQFVGDVNEITQQYINQDKIDIDEEIYQVGELKSETSFYSVKTYFVGQFLLRIKYGDRGLEAVIHPLISQFEVKESEIVLHEFEIFRNSEKLFFIVDNEIIETLGSEETGYLKAAVLLKLMEILYGKRKDDWMLTLHAAAVTDGTRAIVFPAKAGSGKSTLSALLHAHGFQLLSDDFLAMDFNHQKIYPLPVAATIKEGSIDVLSPFYPELRQIPVEHAYTGKQVRYLPVNRKFNPNEGYLAKHFVFITYLPDSPCLFNEVPKKLALQSLLEETWVNPTPSSVKEFFKWFDKTKFFELKYSETSDAIEVVSKLFTQ